MGVVLLLLDGLLAAQPENSSQIEELTKEIVVKQTLRSDKQDDRAELRVRIETLQDEYERLQIQRVDLATRLHQAQQAVNHQSKIVHEQNSKRLNKAQHLLWSAVATQQLKERSPVTMLLLQNDPLKVDRLYRYHRYFNESFANQVEAMEEVVLRQKKILEETQSANQELSLLSAEFDSNSEEIESRKQRLTQLNFALNEEIRALDTDIEQLTQERENLRTVISQRIPPTARSTPVPTPNTRSDVSAWPAVGEVQTRYGAKRADGRIRSEGIVIAAERGSSITAVANGTVVFSQWLSGYGNTLIIDHGDEVISIYAHCEQLLKQTGEPVETGEVIANVGMSEELNQSGLYFEIRVRNQHTDPLTWLRRN